MADDTKTPLFDDEALGLLDELMRERHGAALKLGETLHLEAWAEEGACYTTLLLRNADESLYYPMEARVAVAAGEAPGAGVAASPQVASRAEAGKLLVDALDYSLGQYLRGDRDVYLTIDWSELRFGEHVIQARGQVLNRKLERMADAILEAAGGIPDDDDEL